MYIVRHAPDIIVRLTSDTIIRLTSDTIVRLPPFIIRPLEKYCKHFSYFLCRIPAAADKRSACIV